MRYADALHTGIEFLEFLGCKVGQDKCNDITDNGCEESPRNAVGHKINHRADEGEVPIVPKVDIYGTRATEQQQHEVNSKTNGDNKRAHQCVVSHRRGSRPSHIKYFQLEAVNLNNIVKSRTKRTRKQSRNDTQSDESHADIETAFQGFRKFYTDANAQKSEDNRHHYGCTEADNVTEYLFHDYVLNCLIDLVCKS